MEITCFCRCKTERKSHRLAIKSVQCRDVKPRDRPLVIWRGLGGGGNFQNEIFLLKFLFLWGALFNETFFPGEGPPNLSFPGFLRSSPQVVPLYPYHQPSDVIPLFFRLRKLVLYNAGRNRNYTTSIKIEYQTKPVPNTHSYAGEPCYANIGLNHHQ